MKQQPQTTVPTAIDASRRWFLGGAVGLGAAGAGLATLGAQASGQATPEAAERSSAKHDLGYHETDHIRRYYRSAR